MTVDQGLFPIDTKNRQFMEIRTIIIIITNWITEIDAQLVAEGTSGYSRLFYTRRARWGY